MSISRDLINFHMPDNHIAHPDSLEKKLYQLIISRLDGGKIHDDTYQKKIFRLLKKGIGGFIVFGGKREEIKRFLSKAQSLSEVPLFIASDIERGVGQQINGSTPLPCQMAVAAAINKNNAEDREILKGVVKAIADEAVHVGINMPLIPVLDVNQNPLNPIICTRAFSDNPLDVAWFGEVYIKMLEARGLISSAKHFPGHGDTEVDSHILLPVIRKPLKNLMDVDIMPFMRAIKAGVSSVMIGHLSVRAIDSAPSSLSKGIITGILRKRLGFQGIVLTDALNMGALKNIKDVPLKCIKAGADILLHPEDAHSTVRELISSLKSKKLTEDEIDDRVTRILEVKSRLRNIKKSPLNYKKHGLLSRHVTDMSMTLIRQKKAPLLLNENNVEIILAGDAMLYKSSLLRRHFKYVSEIAEVDRIKKPAAVFAIFSGVSAWKGTSGIGDGQRHRISKLIKEAEGSIVISFGSPYVLGHFKNADMLIAAYEATDNAERAVIRCLKGEMDFKGHLPVRIGL